METKILFQVFILRDSCGFENLYVFHSNACWRNPIFHFVNAFEWKHTNIDLKLLNLEKKPTYFDVLMEWMPWVFQVV